MNWTKFESVRKSSREGLTLGSAQLHIGKHIYKEIGSPERVEVFYDIDSKAIDLRKSKLGNKINVNKNGYTQMACRLSTTGMLKGFYEYDRENKIFLFPKAEKENKV